MYVRKKSKKAISAKCGTILPVEQKGIKRYLKSKKRPLDLSGTLNSTGAILANNKPIFKQGKEVNNYEEHYEQH